MFSTPKRAFPLDQSSCNPDLLNTVSTKIVPENLELKNSIGRLINQLDALCWSQEEHQKSLDESCQKKLEFFQQFLEEQFSLCDQLLEFWLETKKAEKQEGFWNFETLSRELLKMHRVVEFLNNKTLSFKEELRRVEQI